MPQYMLLLRDDPTVFQGLSPEEGQQVMKKYGDWRESLGKRITAGNKLADGHGRVLQPKAGKTAVIDGPFAESKEVMAGYFVLEADGYDQAVEVAKSCPHVAFGTIEIRQVERT
jgi:hypothetical protein